LDTDAKSAAIQLGKALNDPAVGLTFLNRAGITFSATQQTMIKQLAKQGQLSKAQSIILAEVESQFGGTAAAMADPLKQLANSWGDVKEQIGQTIFELAQFSGVFGEAENGLDGVSQKLEGLTMSIFGYIQGIKSMASGVVAFFDLIGEGAGRLANAFETMKFDGMFDGMESMDDRMEKIWDKQTKAIEEFAKKKGDVAIERNLEVVSKNADEATASLARLKGLMGKVTLAGSYAAIQAQFKDRAPIAPGRLAPQMEVAGVRGGNANIIFNQMLNQMKTVARNTGGLGDIEGAI
jgi:phage-related minor tail protein